MDHQGPRKGCAEPATRRLGLPEQAVPAARRLALVVLTALLGCTYPTAFPPPSEIPLAWERPLDLERIVGRGEITIGLVNLEFDDAHLDDHYRDAPYLFGFREAMSTSLGSILAGRGFQVEPSERVLAYREKGRIDLLFAWEIALSSTYHLLVDKNTPVLGDRSVEQHGDLKLRGFVSLMVWEPISDGLLWREQFPIISERQAIDVDFLTAGDRLNQFHNNKDNRHEAFTRALTSVYPQVMERVVELLSPPQLEEILSDAKALRAGRAP